MEQEIDGQIGAASAVLLTQHRSVLRWKAKLSIYRSVYIPTITDGHKFGAVTERMRL